MGGGEDDKRERQERKTSLERRVAEHVLEVQRVQVKRADQDARRSQHHGGARHQ